MHLILSCLTTVALLWGSSALATTAESTPQNRSACAPSAEVQAELDAIGSLTPGQDCPPWQPCWAERVEAVRELAQRYPDNLFVNQALQDGLKYGNDEAAEELRAKYATRASAHPDDAEARYFVARGLEGEERIEGLQDVLELDPDFPQAHFYLASSLGKTRDAATENVADPVAARKHYESFRRLCPEHFQEALNLLNRSLDNPQLHRDELPVLSNLLRQANASDQAHYWPVVWQLRFKAHPVAEHGALRERLNHDLQAVDAVLTADDGAVDVEKRWHTLVTGYEMLGDPEKLRAVRQRAAAAMPCSEIADDLRLEPWRKGERYLSVQQLTEEERRQLFAATDAWIDACPNNFALRQTRFSVVREGLHEDLSETEVLHEIDAYVDSWQPDSQQLPFRQAAELLLELKLQPERVLTLVQRGDEEEKKKAAQQDIDMFPEELRQRIAYSDGIRLLRLRNLRIDALTQLDRLDEARDEVQAFRAESLELVDKAPEDGRAERVDYQESWFLRLQAHIAECEGRSADAFALLRQANSYHEDGEDSEELQRLWAQLGGTDAGLSALQATTGESEGEVAEERSRWEDSSDALGQFTMTDLSGRTWTQDDLEGKAVLVNLWATWCAPCIQELPYIEQLHQRTADNPSLQVVTLNTDRNTGLIAPFLNKHDFTFAVLLGSDYTEERFRDGSVTLPQNWLVTPDGEIRWVQIGFGAGDEEAWMDDIVERLTDLSTDSASEGE